MKPNSSYRHCFDPDVSHECIYRDRVRKPAFAPRLPNGAKSGAPIFAADLGALPELIGVIVAASTITGVFFKLPSGRSPCARPQAHDGAGRALLRGAAVPLSVRPRPLVAARAPLRPRLRDCDLFSGRLGLCGEPGRDRARRSARLQFSSANDIGATGGPLVGGFVLYFTSSFTLTYLLVGALGVLTLLVVLLLPEVDPPARQTKTFTARTAEFRQGLAEVLRTPPIFVAAGIEAVMYLGYGAFLGFLPIYARKVGLNDAEIAIVLGAQQLWPWWRNRSPDGCPIGSGECRHHHRPPALRCRASADLPERKSDGFRSLGAAARPRRRRGHAGDQCAHRRPRLDAAPGRRHGRIRNHLGHRRRPGP